MKTGDAEKRGGGGSREKTGTIAISRTGVGFVDLGFGEDVIIPSGATGTALAGDTVAVVPAGYDRGRRAGRVVRVVERARERFVGTVYQEDGSFLFRPDERRVHARFKVIGGETKQGYKCVFRMTGWTEGAPLPEGEVLELIGPVGDHETEMRAFILREGFAVEFPADVVRAGKELEEHGRELMASEAGKRRDFRGTTTFTIDPVDAKDFDDALSVKENEDGTVEIGIHIADVSFFVRPGDPIDREGRKRATSIYLVDRTVPMLPEILSNDLCSLVPNQDRLAFSAVLTMTKDGTVTDTWFGETVIHSDKRFSYEEAQGVLDAGEGPLLAELMLVRDIARKVRAERTRNGAFSFDTPEVKVEVDETGKPVRIYFKERRETNLLIEDFMLLANQAVATYMHGVVAKDGTSFIYRVHDAPDPEKLADLAAFLRAMGHELKVGDDGRPSAKAMNELFAQVAGVPEEYLIKTTAIRSMSKAIYTTRNIGHFGLAFRFYTHFTSPIRRYPDLMVHRLVKAHLAGVTPSKAELARLEEDALHSTEREIAAADAERDSIKLKQVEFMAGKVGQVFDASITGVTERGLFVAENTTRSEGMIRVRDMGDDYYLYDGSKFRLLGQRTGKSYRLGDAVTVKLVGANPEERTLDFALVQN